MTLIEIEVIKRSAIAFDCKDEDITIIKRLTGGLSNYTYHIKVFGKEYTYRKIGEGGNLFVDRKTEFKTITAIDPLGINPKVLFYDVDTGEKIQTYVDGQTLQTLQYKDHLDKVVKSLKTLHAFETDQANDYGLINRLSLYESYTNQRTVKYQELKAFWIEKYLKDHEHNKKVLCHNDAQQSNMIVSDKFYILDWEYVGYNEFYYDLASFGNINFDDALILLDAYLGRSATQEEKNHVRFYRMYQMLQWHQVALYKHSIGLGEKIGVNFLERAITYLHTAESFLPYFNEVI